MIHESGRRLHVQSLARPRVVGTHAGIRAPVRSAQEDEVADLSTLLRGRAVGGPRDGIKLECPPRWNGIVQPHRGRYVWAIHPDTPDTVDVAEALRTWVWYPEAKR